MPSAEEKLIELRSVPLFAELPDSSLLDVANLLEEVWFNAGETIFEHGEHGDAMYLIAQGRLRVHREGRTLNELEAYDVVGEMSALDPEPRSASVTAVEASRLLRLDRAALDQLMTRQPEVANGIIRILCRRLRARLRDMADDYLSLRDLQIARGIQMGFLPETLPQPPNWEIAAYFRPAREVGGDFYDAFALANPRAIAIVMADVCNKGVGAALYMALFRSLIRAFAQQLGINRIGEAFSMPDAQELKQVVVRTNEYMARNHERAPMFATIFFGVLDTATGELTYVNGGHDPPIVVGPDGIKARLQPTGPAVGLFPDVEFAIRSTSLDAGDTLVAYTDGVPEAETAEHAFFTQERLLSLVAPPAPSAQALLERVAADLLSHIAGATQSDDITMLAIRRSPLP